jgi:hypothetical protein
LGLGGGIALFQLFTPFVGVASLADCGVELYQPIE